MHFGRRTYYVRASANPTAEPSPQKVRSEAFSLPKPARSEGVYAIGAWRLEGALTTCVLPQTLLQNPHRRK